MTPATTINNLNTIGADNFLLLPQPAKSMPGLFTYALAHELRNPLTNIKLSVDMLEAAVQDDKLKVFLGIITRSAARMNDLINDLLKLNHGEVQAEKISIHQLLDEALELAKDRLLLKSIVVMRNDTLDFEIILNKAEMKIALTNIIINAIDAMIAGRGQLKIITKLIADKYILVIQDNGCGISKENLKNIFRPYFTSKSDGMGLGLTAAYNFLRSNKVRVNIKSEEGTGTQFVFLFENNHPDQPDAVPFS